MEVSSSHSDVFRNSATDDGDGYSIWRGLGWRIAQTAAGDFVSHGGDNTGFHSTAEFCLKDKSGFVILTNGDGGVELLKRLAPEVSRRLHKD